MKGWKSFIFFTLIGLLGLFTALEGIDITAFLLPLVCHVDPAVTLVGITCAEGIVKIAGLWTTGLAAAGIFLRAITSSPIFKALLGE